MASDQAQVALRVSVTESCNSRCTYCLGDHASPRPERGLLPEHIPRVVRAVTLATGEPPTVRLTGGEPLVRGDLPDLVTMLAEEGVPEIALTTNGRLLGPVAGTLRRAGLARVNVSLDSVDPDRFAAVTRGGVLARTIEGIDAGLAEGLLPVKTNTVVLRGVNDGEVCAIARFGLERGCEPRFIELMPIGASRSVHEDRYCPTSEVRERLGAEFDLGPPCRSDRHAATVCDAIHRPTGGTGVLGFISPVSEPFCDGCRRLRLTAFGELVSCLRTGDGANLGPMLWRGARAEDLAPLVAKSLAAKSPRAPYVSPRTMAATGG